MVITCYKISLWFNFANCKFIYPHECFLVKLPNTDSMSPINHL